MVFTEFAQSGVKVRPILPELSNTNIILGSTSDVPMLTKGCCAISTLAAWPKVGSHKLAAMISVESCFIFNSVFMISP